MVDEDVFVLRGVSRDLHQLGDVRADLIGAEIDHRQVAVVPVTEGDAKSEGEECDEGVCPVAIAGCEPPTVDEGDDGSG